MVETGLVSTGFDWLRPVFSGFYWFRLVSTGRLVETGFDWFRGRDWLRLVETGRDWLTLVSTGLDEFRPVFTGFLLVSTRFDW